VNAPALQLVNDIRAQLNALEALLNAPEPAAALDDGARFRRCLAEVLKHEGGWADHPADPGGATMKGVTLKTYSAWLGRPATKAELKAIPDTHLQAIYEAQYWRAAGCHLLPPGLDLMVFDMAVNSGPARAVRTLQEALGVAADGAFGPITKTAVEAADLPSLLARYSTAREAFYRGLKTFATFGKGWLSRLSAVTDKAKAWA
jgi:lysozyme family protein